MAEVKHDRNALRNFVIAEMKKRNISSHRAFAEFVGVSQATISRIFDENYPYEPSLTLLVQLSKSTNVFILDLVSMVYPDVVNDTSPAPSARVLAQQINSLPDHLRDAITAFIMGAGSVQSE